MMDDFKDELPEEVWQAHLDLLRLNMTLHHPQIRVWLHSEDAVPALKEMLINAPGLGAIH